MKRVIVDYAKLTNEILTLLVERFPEGYDDSNIIRFKNAKNETIEAVEVRTEDTIYLVKVSTKLADRIENFDEDDMDPTDEIDTLKDLDIADDDADDDHDVEEKVDRPDNEDDGEDGDDRDVEDTEYSEEDEDEDED